MHDWGVTFPQGKNGVKSENLHWIRQLWMFSSKWQALLPFLTYRHDRGCPILHHGMAMWKSWWFWLEILVGNGSLTPVNHCVDRATPKKTTKIHIIYIYIIVIIINYYYYCILYIYSIYFSVLWGVNLHDLIFRDWPWIKRLLFMAQTDELLWYSKIAMENHLFS
jgi:hypothetical protein